MDGERPDWLPDWRGECVAIVGAGPSVTEEQVNLLKDRIHVVAINTSYDLCPWADMLYACDTKWWQLRNGAEDFEGLKVTQDGDAVGRYPCLKRITVKKRMNGSAEEIVQEFLMDRWCEVGGGGNSGFQVLNLLAQIGVAAVALLGFDFRNYNGKVHWHGRHPDSGRVVLTNPCDHNFRRWVKWMETAAPRMREVGMDVVNCSQISALSCFPKMTVTAALGRWGL